MSESKLKLLVLVLKMLYFGWVLSFPLYGPVLKAGVSASGLSGIPLPQLFILSHSITFLLCGIFLKNVRIWFKLMTWSLVGTILVNFSLLLPFDVIWVFAMLLFGVFAAIYILGWSCIFSLNLPLGGRLKFIAAMIIAANLIYFITNYLSMIIPANVMVAVVILPLLAALVILIKIPENFKRYPQRTKPFITQPVTLLTQLCVFIFIVYLNGGLMYGLMVPIFDHNIAYAPYLRYFVYILVLLIIYWYGEKYLRRNTIYLGVAILGLSFIAFALYQVVLTGLIFSTILIESGFAFLDLFVWVTLAKLAFQNRAPYQFFGFGLAANTAGIFFGGLIAAQVMNLSESFHLYTAIISSSAIFIAMFFFPTLYTSQQAEIDASNYRQVKENQIEPELKMEKHLLTGQRATRREQEIIELIMRGLTNNEVAEELSISNNTIKTHLKNIYMKFGVTRKRELIALLSRNYTTEK